MSGCKISNTGAINRCAASQPVRLQGQKAAGDRQATLAQGAQEALTVLDKPFKDLRDGLKGWRKILLGE